YSTRADGASPSGFVTLTAHGSLRRAARLRPDASGLRGAARRHKATRGRGLPPGRDLRVRRELRALGQPARPGRRAAPGGARRLRGLKKFPHCYSAMKEAPMRYAIVGYALVLAAFLAGPAQAQVHVDIGIHFPAPPQVVVVPQVPAVCYVPAPTAPNIFVYN